MINHYFWLKDLTKASLVRHTVTYIIECQIDLQYKFLNYCVFLHGTDIVNMWKAVLAGTNR